MTVFELQIFWFTLAPTWYGLAYAVGFLLGYHIVKRRGRVPVGKVDDLLLCVFFWVFLGGRLGYVLFYNLPYYLGHPLEILATWKGGMSFHGGVIGVLLGMWAYSAWKKEGFLKTADEVVLILPIGIGLGRIANFLNGELYGYAPYFGPFAMDIGGIPHFPSPLLEALLEGPLLGAILYFASRRKLAAGSLGAIFLAAYAVVRIFAEFFRLPDAHIGYLVGFVTMGQALSFLMLASGIFLFFHFNKRHGSKKLQ